MRGFVLPETSFYKSPPSNGALKTRVNKGLRVTIQLIQQESARLREEGKQR